MISHDQTDLFPSPRREKPEAVPLAERLRPRILSDIVGHDKILGNHQPLRQAIESDTVPSMILWGPPGSGKTSLAHVIAQTTKSAFAPFSAVTSGIPELRSIIKTAKQRSLVSGQPTIVFVDEIHRFNKAQQDAFLPHVERGDITLIGATTQNPSFEIIAPLLSRCLVLVLDALPDAAMRAIIDRALTDQQHGFGRLRVTLTEEAKQALIQYGNGDARSTLTALEFAVTQATPQEPKSWVMDLAQLEHLLMQKTLRYDRQGEEHYNLISAFIKSLRDSDSDAGLYWLARMLEGGEDPKFIARRLVIFASEDIGNANAMALMVATSVFQAVEMVGLPEAQINLAHGTTYLATSPKSNASYVGLLEARHDAKQHGNLPVPLHLRNAVTSLMKAWEYGKGYRYVHDDPDAQQEQSHLPEPLKGKIYYQPQKTDVPKPDRTKHKKHD
ncbi:MAG: AAA family ATPase [Nitrospirales bacterium]|nr:AAA family ATPase [Nitrospirales bacterium]